MPSPHRPGDGSLPVLPPGFAVGVDADGLGLTRAPGARDCATAAADVGRLAGLGVTSARVALSWPRLQPSGAGPLEETEARHVDLLLDALAAAGIRPSVTLHDGVLPEPLQADGGWLNRATADRLADLAALAGERWGDRVEHWVPVDQPARLLVEGHMTGRAAPGLSLAFDALPVAHHLLLAHGRAVLALRATARGRSPVAPPGRGAADPLADPATAADPLADPLVDPLADPLADPLVDGAVTGPSIGCANHHAPMWPASEDVADVAATKLHDALWNALFLEPMLLGRYPVDLQPLLEGVVRDGDLATIRQPLDFYGVTYDSPLKIGIAGEESEVPFERCELLGYPETHAGTPVVPDALREWLIMFRARYRAALPPLQVTLAPAPYVEPATLADAGTPGATTLAPDGPDGSDGPDPRTSRLEGHLRAVATAVQRGVDVRALHVGPLLDQAAASAIDAGPAGALAPVGLLAVDPVDGTRTPRPAYHWLAAVVGAQTRSLG